MLRRKVAAFLLLLVLLSQAALSAHAASHFGSDRADCELCAAFSDGLQPLAADGAPQVPATRIGHSHYSSTSDPVKPEFRLFESTGPPQTN